MIAWTDAKLRNKRSARYYRYNLGRGNIVINANGDEVKKKNPANKCLAYDISNMKFLRKGCRTRIHTICTKGTVSAGFNEFGWDQANYSLNP